MNRAVVGVVAISMGMIATSSARADPNDATKNFSLEWSAPPGCPSTGDMQKRIQNLIVHVAKTTDPVSARVVVSLEKNGHLSADVELGATQKSRRHIDGDSCEGISDAVALIVAFAADPGQAHAEPDPPPKPLLPAKPLTPPQAPPPTPPAPVPPKSDPETRYQFFARASGRADFGAVPSAVVGGELAVGWNPAHLELAITGALLTSARAAISSGSEGADISLAEVGTHGCYEIFDSRFDVGPCAGAEGRWLSAHGFGSAHPSDATAFIGALSFGVAGKAHVIPRFSLRIDALADVPLSRPTFEIDSTGVVYKAAPWGIHTTIGAELNF